jgi:CxxC motif-containing protein
MVKNLVCIECPKGCVLTVDIKGTAVKSVSGAKCPKGKLYAAAEAANPSRILTATVLARGMDIKLVPVRTDKPIPKKDLLRAMKKISDMVVTKPLEAGETVAENFLGLGAKLVATRRVEKGK